MSDIRGIETIEELYFRMEVQGKDEYGSLAGEFGDDADNIVAIEVEFWDDNPFDEDLYEDEDEFEGYKEELKEEYPQFAHLIDAMHTEYMMDVWVFTTQWVYSEIEFGKDGPFIFHRTPRNPIFKG